MMNSAGRMAFVGFVLFVSGALVGAAWLGVSGVLASTHGWWLAGTFVLMAAGLSCFLFFRSEPEVRTAGLEEAARGTVVALVGCRTQLERIVTHLECLEPSLQRISEPTEGIVGGLQDCLGQLERLAERLTDAAPAQSPEFLPPDLPTEEESSTPVVDLGQGLLKAWERYRRDGDGYFNAEGLRAELVSHGIDAKVEDLEQDEHGFLLVADESSSDRGFFVVPDFTHSPRSAARWFEDHSSKRLGGRIKELRRLGRGRLSNHEPEVVEKGVVA